MSMVIAAIVKLSRGRLVQADRMAAEMRRIQTSRDVVACKLAGANQRIRSLECQLIEADKSNLALRAFIAAGTSGGAS